MDTKTIINITSILLVIISIIMIVISYKAKILPPALTGIGFLLITWVIQMLK